jgi:hypothetical protein
MAARAKTVLISGRAGAARFATALAPKTRLGLAFRNAVINALAIPGLGARELWPGDHRRPAASRIPLADNPSL